MFVRSLTWNFGLSALVALTALFFAATDSVADAEAAQATLEGGPVVYELRTYTTHEGRLPALEARFRDHTMGLFEKHGMRNIGYWIPVDKPNTLIYIIAHVNAASVQDSWQAFASDPAWQTVARNSQKDGPILIDGGVEKQFMTATDFSPLK